MSLLTSFTRPQPAASAPRWRSGRYYDYNTMLAGAIGTLTPGSAGLIYATPAFNPEPTPINQLAVECTTLGAVSHCYYGVYLDLNDDGIPDTLLIQGTEADLTGTGIKSTTVDIIVPAGVVYGAAIFDTTAATMRGTSAPTLSPGGHTAAGETLARPTITAAASYGPLPATFPAVLGSNDIRCFRVAMRAA